MLKFSNRPVEIFLKIIREYGINTPIIRAEHGNVEDLVKTIWSKNWSKRQKTFSDATRIHLLGKNFLESSRFNLQLNCRSFTCPSPVYPREIKTIKHKRRLRFLYSGRLEVYEKNAPFAVEAFLSVAEQLPDWDLHIMGDGTARKEMEAATIAHPEFSNRIIYHGSLAGEDLEDGYRSGDIFLMTSYVEGAPVALGEALAYGVPAIGFKYCTGVNERILDNENGFLVEDDSQFKDKMLELAGNAELRKQLSKNAPLISKRYAPEKIFEKWIINFQLAHWFGENRSDTVDMPKTKYTAVLKNSGEISDQHDLSKLSIVVPYFNMEEQFSLTIESFNKAAEAGASVLIVDDGSLKPFQNNSFVSDLHPNIRYISTFNFGTASARNLGLSYTKTDYVLFFDADDTLNIPNIDKALKIVRSSNYDFITMPFIHQIVKDGTFKKVTRLKYRAILNAASQEELLRVFCPQIDASSCNKIINTSFLKKNHISFLDNYRLEDVAFNAACYQAAKDVVLFNEEVGYYNKFKDIDGRLGSSSWSIHKMKDALYIFNLLDKTYGDKEARLYNAVYFLAISDVWRKMKTQMKTAFPDDFNSLNETAQKIRKLASQYPKMERLKNYGSSTPPPLWVKIRYEEAKLTSKAKFFKRLKNYIFRKIRVLS